VAAQKTLNSLLSLFMATLLLHSGSSFAGEGSGVLLDAFENLSEWNVITSESAHLEIAQDADHTGMSMRLDFDLKDGAGFVIARKTFAVPLPENYVFKFHLRGDAPPNNLEFKVVDRSGAVWWFNQRNFKFSRDWRQITIKKRQLEFAWGPPGSALQEVAAIEFAITPGTRGKGSIWIDELRFEAREPVRDYALTPSVRASTTTDGDLPELVLDQDTATGWRSGSLAEDQWLSIDFLKNREYGGLVIDWDPEDYATAYQVRTSDDGEDWKVAYAVTAGNGGRDYLYLPDTESRYVRLDLQKSSRGKGYGINTVTVKSYDFSSSPNRLFETIARDTLRGLYPKYFYGEQSYWTLVGVSGDHKKGLLNQEGLLEVDKGGFSIEPFLYANGRLLTWNDVEPSQELARGYLPIPTVTWKHEPYILKITAFAAGEAGASTLYARYRIENISAQQQPVSLFLAIRPFQVNPPWQNLNTTGGTSTIHNLSQAGRTVWIDEQKAVTSLTTADRFGATVFDQGSITDYLTEDKLPPQANVSDPFGYASGALEYRLDLPPRSAKEIYLAIPFHEARPAVAANLTDDEASAVGRQQLDEALRYWETKLNRIDIQLPAGAEKIANTLKSTLAYILINRDGPAIQPGSRCYARSWIRDGALTSAALLSMGYTDEVRDFIRWFAQYQSASGKIPCCVDYRGADPTPEHDSHGEFIYLVMEYYRYTRDIGFLNELWPHVVKTVEYIDSLRQQRLTEAFRTGGLTGASYGLMPESISHEGYSAHTQHSYWDDFFILRGLKDAASMAIILGEEQRAVVFAALRDAFRSDLYASLSRTMALHGIGYLPGSVELGDFDPTSTTIAVDPGGELANLPAPALTRTFDDYYKFFRQRRDGLLKWEAYTPYELRIVGTLIQLGRKAQAHEALAFFLAGQRPAAWNQWAEVVWHDPDIPRFIGDMPHTWVGSDYIRSVRNLFAYEREADQALVIGAGVPGDWLQGDGVSVKRLPTYHGALNYTLRAAGPGDLLRLRLSGDVTLPPGKIVVRSPLAKPLQGVIVNGKAVTTFTTDEAMIGEFPAEVLLRYNP